MPHISGVVYYEDVMLMYIYSSTFANIQVMELMRGGELFDYVVEKG